MLSSEFNREMGSLIRSLEGKVAQEPSLRDPEFTPLVSTMQTLDHLERAIVTLVATYFQLRTNIK